MNRPELRKVLLLALAGVATLLTAMMVRGLGPELVRYARMRQM
jgi:hypothetical protein